MTHGEEHAGGHRRRAVAALAGTALCAAVAATALAGAPAGSLKQVAGKDGCYTFDGASADGAGTCRNIRGGNGSTTIAIAPGGRHAYVIGYGDNGVPDQPVLSAFRRDRDDGDLHQVAGRRGCYSSDGGSEDGPGTCVNARNIDSGDATSIAISRDGRFLYTASQVTDQGGLAIFRRSRKSGKLRQLKGKRGCITISGESEDGPGTCAVARAVESVSNLRLTPDQRYLYAANYEGPPFSGIAIFKRSRKTGRLRQLKGKNGCLTTEGFTTVSDPDVVCRKMANLSNPWDIATPDNRFAYVPAAYGPDLIQAFKRNAGGGLVPLTGRRSCVSNDGTSDAGDCVDGVGLDNPERALLSKNERFIYANSYSAPSPVAVLNRNPRTGKLSQRTGKAACVSVDGSSGAEANKCRDGRAISGGYAGALSPNGRTLYFTEHAADAVSVFRLSPKTGAFRQLAGKRGCVSVDGASEDGPDTCRKARAIEGSYQVEVAGRDVYVASYNANGVAHLRAAR